MARAINVACLKPKNLLILTINTAGGHTLMMTKPMDEPVESGLFRLARTLHNQWLIATAFVFSVAVMIIVALTAQHLAERTIDNSAKVVDLQYEKLHNLLNLQLARLNRTVNLGMILMLKDPFEQDKAMTAFYHSGHVYTLHRDKLAFLTQGNPQEMHWITEINGLANVTAPIQNRIASMAMSGHRDEGISLLTHKVVPRLDLFTGKVNDFAIDQAKDTKRLIVAIKHQADNMVYAIIIFTLLFIAISGALAFSISQKFLRMNQRLKQANDSLEKEVESRTKSLVETQDALLEKNRILEELSITDPLTQLYNRLRIESLMEGHQQHFEKTGETFCLLLIDLDFFKNINDTYGHNQGDQVLVELSVCLKLFFSENAHLGRWGGEEFIVLMEGCNQEQATQTGEAFRKLVENHEFSIEEQLTASIGVATIAKHESIAEFIHRADMALYTAKHEGRNRVCLSPMPDKKTSSHAESQIDLTLD